MICRLVSILGERYTHGHVIDFYKSLKDDSDSLVVLGDGKQEKSYLYVKDCIAAMLFTATMHEQEAGAHVYNLGTEETVSSSISQWRLSLAILAASRRSNTPAASGVGRRQPLDSP